MAVSALASNTHSHATSTTDSISQNMSQTALKVEIITRDEVAKHKYPKDAWIIIGRNVYDISEFEHPAGNNFIARHLGKDATMVFYASHGDSQLLNLDSYYKGIVATDRLGRKWEEVKH